MSEETESPRYMSAVFIYRSLMIVILLTASTIFGYVLDRWINAQDAAIADLQKGSAELLLKINELQRSIDRLEHAPKNAQVDAEKNQEIIEYRFDILEEQFRDLHRDLKKHLEEHSKGYWKGISNRKSMAGFRGATLSNNNPADDEGKVMPPPRPAPQPTTRECLTNDC